MTAGKKGSKGGMKKAIGKITVIMILLLMVLSMAGCEQVTRLQSLLPGAQTEAAQEETQTESSGPVTGDISELQNSLSWVYLIQETEGKGESPAGILIYNPVLGGYSMNGAYGSEALIEWDGREFDLEAEESQTAPGWYHSAQLAMNIRNQNFLLQVNLLREEEEDIQIRLENPKIALLEWPSLADKNGIVMEKAGDTYTFSAKTIKELFTESVPGVFTYRIKDCTDCNVQLDGEQLQYRAISGKKASFTVEITDPAGQTRQVPVGISLKRNLMPLLTGLVIAAAVIAAAVILFLLGQRKKRKAIREEASAAQEEILQVKAEAEPVLDSCRQLSKSVPGMMKDVMKKVRTFGGVIDPKTVENAAAEAQSLTESPTFETLRIYLSDLEKLSDMLDGGKKLQLVNPAWTKELFLQKKSRDRELAAVRETMEDLKKEYQQASEKLRILDGFTNPGKEPFGFDFEILIQAADAQWNCTIEKGSKGRQKLGDMYFMSKGKRITRGTEILSADAAETKIVSGNEDTILISSGSSNHQLFRGDRIRLDLEEDGAAIEIRSN